MWAEIAAFAERVGVPPARGLFLRAGTLPHGCSAFAWRLADGRVLAGRNYDFAASFPNRHLLTGDDPTLHPLQFPALPTLPAELSALLEAMLQSEPAARPRADEVARQFAVRHG